jgi:hypothetical protein
VSGFGQLPDRASARERLRAAFDVPDKIGYVLYPVRGIRRKNLGEALLWSAAATDSHRLGLTLPPLNPIERPCYESWKRLAGECGLPFLFEVGGTRGLSLGDNLAAADLVISTSVAEGFGMVFLETWLAGRCLVGRDLPEITADFVRAGLRLDGLAPELVVPLDWVGRAEYQRALQQAYFHVLDAYGRPHPSASDFARAADELVSDGLLDFARCSARLQGIVISQVVSNAAWRERLLELNPGMRGGLAGNPTPTADLVQRNATAVRRAYSLESSGQRLRGLYQQVLASPRRTPQVLEHGSAVLDAFLGLARLHPIRIE